MQGELGIDLLLKSRLLEATPSDRLNLKWTVGGAEHRRAWGMRQFEMFSQNRGKFISRASVILV